MCPPCYLDVLLPSPQPGSILLEDTLEDLITCWQCHQSFYALLSPLRQGKIKVCSHSSYAPFLPVVSLPSSSCVSVSFLVLSGREVAPSVRGQC